MVHPLKNILNKLRWDRRESGEEYLITYRHRGAPRNVRQVRASEIRKLGNSFFTLSDPSDAEETIIPFHRIIEVRRVRDSELIWRSRKPAG